MFDSTRDCHIQECTSPLKLYQHINSIIAERLSARQLILHRISASVCIYNMYIYICVCVTLRNAIILRTAHGVAGPFVVQFSRATFMHVG